MFIRALEQRSTVKTDADVEFSITTRGKMTTRYQADSQESLDVWVNVIQQAINELNSPMATKIINTMEDISQERLPNILFS